LVEFMEQRSESTAIDLEQDLQQQGLIRKLKQCLDVCRLINSTLELSEVLERIMTTSKEIMQADACSLLLVDENTDELVFQVAHGSVGDQLKQGFRLPRGKGIGGHVCDTGAPLLIADAYQDPRFHRDFDQRTGYRTRSILCVPLKVKDRVIGVSQVINKLDGTAFTQDDCEILSMLNMHAAVAIENARMHQALLRKQQMESDLAFATAVQQSFLPRTLPELPELQFRAYYQSALEVGGDFYDFILLPGRRLGILIGDVSGKGVASALYMAQLTSELRLSAIQFPDPAMLVARINELLCERSQRGMFVTLLYMVLDVRERTLTYVNAGHLPPLLWNDGLGRFEVIRSSGGPPLGILSGRRYVAAELRLGAGDCLVLATDGIIEARNPGGEQFGWERLGNAVQAGPARADAVFNRVLAGIKAFMRGAPQADDITMVVMGTEAAREGSSET
jgi:sigma-B regulation protein RsbU (phosphoserine phosphatase)